MAAITMARLSDVTSAIIGVHGCQIIRASGNFAVGNNTYTAVQFNGTDVLDTDTMHDPSSSNTRVTIPSIASVTTGLWLFTVRGYTDATSGRVDVKFRKAGTTDLAAALVPAHSSAVSGFQLAAQFVLSATEYVECLVRTSGGSFSVTYEAGISPVLEATFLGKVT